MDIDHIFIFTDNSEKVVDELISFGFKPNDSRVHQGQGTSNRTFSFENFYLEIVWVDNAEEIKSNLIKPTGLWQRAEFFRNNFVPFGLIILNNQASDNLFENAYKYQPEYFAEGMAFDILQNALEPNLPWTCRMPFRREKNTDIIQVTHNNQLQSLTKALFEYNNTSDDDFINHFKDEKTIHFIKSDQNWLTLTFDDGRQGLKRIFEQLQLTIDY